MLPTYNSSCLTLFQTGSGMTLSDGGGPLWPSLIFCYITQQKVALTPKTCSQIKFLIFRHPFTPLFQHSREPFPPLMSINVDQHLHIETLKIIEKPLKMKKNCLIFLWHSKYAILIAWKFLTWNLSGIKINFFCPIQRGEGPFGKKICLWFHSNFICDILRP